MTTTVLWAALLGYVIGSIPFGLLLTRAAGMGDVRNIGSGNIGATNVLRTGNKGLAAATLLLDLLKGFAAVTIAGQLWGEVAMAFAAGAAVLGHCFPVWLGFKGGKGVATFLGVLLAVLWPVGLLVCATWLGMALVFRISSLSALTASAVAPLLALAFGRPDVAVLALFLAALLWWRHKENIARLVRGEEPRIGAKKA